MRNSFFALFALLFALFSSASFAQMQQTQVVLNTLDSQIDLDIDANNGAPVNAIAYLSQNIPARNTLFVMLPGTKAFPEMHYSRICTTAAKMGYHSIGLPYKNSDAIGNLCPSPSSSACSYNTRMEIITGQERTTLVDVDQANSIIHRLKTFLLYLHTENPNRGWDQFIDIPADTLEWEKIAFGGHSQGGGHAALIAQNHVVNRVLFFNSPTDPGSPDWLFAENKTPSQHYYGFIHWDNQGPIKEQVYQAMGMEEWGLRVNVNQETPPYSGRSHILVTDYSTFEHATWPINLTCRESGSKEDPHSDIIVNCELPVNALGETPFQEVWEYMLTNDVNIHLPSGRELAETSEFSLSPNPVSNVATVDVPDGSPWMVEVRDLTGNVLNQRTVLDEEAVDFSNLSPGIYDLVVYDLDEVWFFRFQKL